MLGDRRWISRGHARARSLARGQYHLRQVRLIQMDATEIKFPDNSFDIVYAPYFINCVPDPIAVTQRCGACAAPMGGSSS